MKRKLAVRLRALADRLDPPVRGGCVPYPIEAVFDHKIISDIVMKDVIRKVRMAGTSIR